ncbi:MAG: acetate--CoA ligase [Deltaproteobacteria bacterium]|nr:acetate--CoA ligase [Deltaproteobacteria bacterium]MBW2413188.1 acetate--CoA ligase [Deltaproteobacteria bacterium]
MTHEIEIESTLKETRKFKPDAAWARRANVPGQAAYKRMAKDAAKNPQRFWARMAKEHVSWFTPWKKVLDWKPPYAKWFIGGKTNVSYNCLDRHLEGENAWRKNKAALIWEGEPGDERVLTYGDLHREVCKFANVLKGLGVKKGDRVILYMPLVPELAIAMLSCTRIGAVHSIIFGGFAADSISDRVNDAQAKLIVTADGGWRRGSIVQLKGIVDEALEKTDCVEKVVVYKRTGHSVNMKDGRDLWWDDLMAEASADCKPAKLDSEAPLFILYTSGSTGKPKGILHTTGGYLTHVATTAKYIFDLKDEDTYWCTADIGWVTGHSYVVYGILANGATSLMYEGAPNWPDEERFWRIIDKYKVTVFYTAPTAIRTFMKWGDDHIKKYSLASLRLLGTVGEPINPEAWMWYRRVIGRNHCPIVDTYWQTETGGIMISPVPGGVTTTPGSATLPFPGISADILDHDGNPVGPNEGGFLAITKPWPGMLRGIYGDPERYVEQYWSKFPDKGIYFAGDGARRDKSGNFWVMGRVDDVMNVAGHRLSTMEVESALVSHPAVAEAAVVGRPDDIKGTAVVCFVTLEGGVEASDEMGVELRKHVGKEIGPVARPDEVRFTDALPKTRSGKIMRRLLRDIAAGRETSQDTTTLEDLSVLARLRESDEA